MKKVFVLIMASVIIVALASCTGSKESAKKDLSSLTDRLEKNSGNYSQKDWEEAVNEYKEIEKEIQKNSYTAEEEKEINRMRGRCLGYFAKSMIHNYANQAVGFMQGLMESTSQEEFEEEINGLSKSIQDIFDSRRRHDDREE